jgi:hypothetical protein
VRGVAQDAVVEAWLTLPRRIYLDTGTLQTLYDYGETLWTTSRSSRFDETARSPACPTSSMPCATSSWSMNGHTSSAP